MTFLRVYIYTHTHSTIFLVLEGGLLRFFIYRIAPFPPLALVVKPICSFLFFSNGLLAATIVIASLLLSVFL